MNFVLSEKGQHLGLNLRLMQQKTYSELASMPVCWLQVGTSSKQGDFVVPIRRQNRDNSNKKNILKAYSFFFWQSDLFTRFYFWFSCGHDQYQIVVGNQQVRLLSYMIWWQIKVRYKYLCVTSKEGKKGSKNRTFFLFMPYSTLCQSLSYCITLKAGLNYL